MANTKKYYQTNFWFQKDLQIFYSTCFDRTTSFSYKYRNVCGKSSAKSEYRDENVFLKVDRALSKIILITYDI